MDKRGKIAFVIVMVIVAFLLGLSIFLTNRVLVYQQTFEKIAGMQRQLSDIKSGRNGSDGVDGQNGRDGINATSYEKVETNTIVQQVPLAGAPGVNGADGKDGKDGKDGAPAPKQEIFFDDSTGNLMQKYSDTDFPTILIPCGKLLVGCPDVTMSIPVVTIPSELK